MLSDLEAVARTAAGLADRIPENDLWAGIEARIQTASIPTAQATHSDAAAGPEAATSLTDARSARFARRISLTIPQLAAAAVALATISTAGAWIVLGGGSGSSVATASGSVEPVVGSALVSTRGPESTGQLAERYGSVIAELENALFDPPNSLAPDAETSLRRALLKIDRAIEDAEKALESLPGDAYLEQHVQATMRRKAEFLRRAVRLSQS
jgi:hypothetical protein